MRWKRERLGNKRPVRTLEMAKQMFDIWGLSSSRIIGNSEVIHGLDFVGM